ncbi:uncharacterized protein LOC107265551 [Cephus cinctus]|uniref:Uncharacterized protein LOC107265551 n=1 Tax=Cephus cinctus TaxID=211228 RepID=A0AAJ7BNS7_CEPCN|nr:uncharacterized protein LOC107265551 [Cephus cinctus]XP_024938710.1 uncharacterized protein LOC107265551 [Cephus cinctus]
MAAVSADTRQQRNEQLLRKQIKIKYKMALSLSTSLHFSSTSENQSISEEQNEVEICFCPFSDSDRDFDEFENLERECEEEEEESFSLWETILRETEDELAPCREWINEQEELKRKIPHHDSPAHYLNNEIFPVLLPAMENMLKQARQWNVLRIQKSRFNGLDYLAEVLWNKSPRHPERSKRWLDVFSIPPFRIWLKLNPRPIYPKSWLWTEEQAALILQRWIRGWIVRKQEDVQEMRQFWKAIRTEKAKDASLGTGQRSEDEDLNPCDRYKLSIKKKINPF